MIRTWSNEKSNIYLRPIEISDASGPYLAWLNDPAVNQYLESRFVPWSLDKLSSYIDNLMSSKDEFLFAICTYKGQKHIGNIKLGPINWNHLFGDIGIIIGDKTEWGKGRAAEAIAAICDYGFNELSLNKIQAGCYEENMGSIKAFQKVGFEEEGRIKHKFMSLTGYQDHILLGLLSDDFIG